MIYKTFKQLNGKTLKKGDKVELAKNLTYDIGENGRYLMLLRSRNDKVFEHYGVSKFVINDIYGYKANSYGIWPEAKNFDFEALTRAALYFLAIKEKFKAVRIYFGPTKFKDFNLTGLHKENLRHMQITDRYEGLFTPDYLKVGCQKISYKKIKEVYERAKKLRYL